MRKVKRDTSRQLAEDLDFLRDYLTTYFIEYKRRSKYVEAFRSLGHIQYQLFEDHLMKNHHVERYKPFIVPLSRALDWGRMLGILIDRLGFKGFKIVVTQKCFECALLQATIVAMESANERATRGLRVDAVLYTTDPLFAETVAEHLKRRGDVAVSVERRDVSRYEALIKYVVSGARVGKVWDTSFPATSSFGRALITLAFLAMFPPYGYKAFNKVAALMASEQKDLLDTGRGETRLESGAEGVVKFTKLVTDEKLKIVDKQVISTEVNKKEKHKPLLLKYDVEGENLHYEVQNYGWVKMAKLLVSLVDDKYSIVSVNTIDNDVLVAVAPAAVAFIPGWAGPVLVPVWIPAKNKAEREKWAKRWRESLYRYITKLPLMMYVIDRYRKYARMQLEDYKRGRWPPPEILEELNEMEKRRREKGEKKKKKSRA